MDFNQARSFAANGISYQPTGCPVAVICLDGSADEYLDAAMSRGRMPRLQAISNAGFRGLARGAMPSFTNVNNASIVTGVPPSVHGIGGNFFFDASTGREVMMNSAQFLKCETLFPAAARAGWKVGVVTAKEKLRDIFASKLIEAGGIAFSSEKAMEARFATHGVEDIESLVGPTPAIYSGEASLYVLKAGVSLLEGDLANLLYLSTTDFMQHKHEPASTEALDFYAALDVEIGRLIETGAVVAITADHGMNAKQKPDGSQNALYLETELNRQFGTGWRVILPITDPYVAHHGALGSFAQIHLPAMHTGRFTLNGVLAWLMTQPGITEALDRNTAARLMELPADRMGDIVVCAGRNWVIGRTPEYHDLKAVEGGLRSHGGRHEEMVPFILSRPLKPEYAARARGDLRNFHLFDFALNGTIAP
ncbi:MAG: phosphonoacetate hydrolase [Verrucomicrobia bacterium]|nr:phosphonoacetate hydrolase [Verrucomicrobiota bacterium]